VSGTITTTTWTKANSPYRVTGTITVPYDNTLTIEPGVDVLFDSAVQVVVNGALNAVGTPQDSIRFLKSGENYWGGIQYSSPRLHSMAFVRISGASGLDGGGIRNYWGSLEIVNSVISDNTASRRGGGVYNAGSVGGTSLTLANCTISGNTASSGAAIHNGGTASLTNCLVSGNNGSNAVIYNGQGIDATATLTMRNCTVYGNNGGGWATVRNLGLVTSRSTRLAYLTLQNTVVWGNSPAQQIENWNGQATVTYSDIQQESGVFAGTGNINADPLFIDPGTDSMRLHSTSPCRDAGDPASPLDPDGSRADMGARPFDPTLTVESPRVPLRFLVMQNAPNPFNPSTTIRFTLPEAGHVTLAVYDINGRLVRTLVGQAFLPGHHEVVWDGKDAMGRAVASGVYVYRLTAPQGVVTKRMTLLR